MARLMDCNSCSMGDHSGHVRVIRPPPEGGVGGAACDCRGDCGERNKNWAEDLFPPCSLGRDGEARTFCSCGACGARAHIREMGAPTHDHASAAFFHGNPPKLNLNGRLKAHRGMERPVICEAVDRRSILSRWSKASRSHRRPGGISRPSTSGCTRSGRPACMRIPTFPGSPQRARTRRCTSSWLRRGAAVESTSSTPRVVGHGNIAANADRRIRLTPAWASDERTS